MKPLQKHINKDKELTEIECFEGLNRLNVLSEEGQMKLHDLKVAEAKKTGICPDRSWHHLYTTCRTCGQRG